MALGTITNVVDQATGASVPVVQGALRMSVTNVVGDSSYPTGGTALSASQLGLNTVLFAQAEIVASSGSNAGAGSASYNVSTGKFQNFTNASVEVTNGTNVSGITWQIIAWGY